MTRRFVLAIIALLIVAPVFAQPQRANYQNPSQSQIQWYTNYNEAVSVAQKQNKPLFLFFTGSDWCGWCKKMEQEIFSSPDFVQAVGNSFVFVDIDFPVKTQLPPDLQQQNATLKQKWAVSGYPTVIILNSNQNFVAKLGYQAGGGRAYADFLRQYLQ